MQLSAWLTTTRNAQFRTQLSHTHRCTGIRPTSRHSGFGERESAGVWTPPTCFNGVLNRWCTTPDSTSPGEAPYKKNGVISRTRPAHHTDRNRRIDRFLDNQTADHLVVPHDQTDISGGTCSFCLESKVDLRRRLRGEPRNLSTSAATRWRR